jgi:lia operon protein LiaF
MRNQNQFYLGIAIVAVGVILLLANIFRIDIGIFCWPMALILLGVFLLLRPRMVDPGTTLTQKFLAEMDRQGEWSVEDEEIWYFVGDVSLDMSEAHIPYGETRLRAVGFVSDLDLRLPQDVGLSVSSTAFVSDTNLLGHKEESFL